MFTKNGTKSNILEGFDGMEDQTLLVNQGFKTPAMRVDFLQGNGKVELGSLGTVKPMSAPSLTIGQHLDDGTQQVKFTLDNECDAIEFVYVGLKGFCEEGFTLTTYDSNGHQLENKQQKLIDDSTARYFNINSKGTKSFTILDYFGGNPGAKNTFTIDNFIFSTE